MTAPAFTPLPPVCGGARAEPTSVGAPSEVPLRPRPEPEFEPSPTVGGGGTMLFARSVPPLTPLPPGVSPVPPPAPASDGGGGTTLGELMVGPLQRELPPVPAATPT